jgi:hypothetical protein
MRRDTWRSGRPAAPGRCAKARWSEVRVLAKRMIADGGTAASCAISATVEKISRPGRGGAIPARWVFDTFAMTRSRRRHWFAMRVPRSPCGSMEGTFILRGTQAPGEGRRGGPVATGRAQRRHNRARTSSGMTLEPPRVSSAACTSRDAAALDCRGTSVDYAACLDAPVLHTAAFTSLRTRSALCQDGTRRARGGRATARQSAPTRPCAAIQSPPPQAA